MHFGPTRRCYSRLNFDFPLCTEHIPTYWLARPHCIWVRCYPQHFVGLGVWTHLHGQGHLWAIIAKAALWRAVAIHHSDPGRGVTVVLLGVSFMAAPSPWTATTVVMEMPDTVLIYHTITHTLNINTGWQLLTNFNTFCRVHFTAVWQLFCWQFCRRLFWYHI